MGVSRLNEKDLRLVMVLNSEIKVNGPGALYLISAKYTNLVRVNLVLLKALLDEKKKKGIMITIDRPHQYVSHLLQLHGIDQNGLVFVDAISSHSSDTKGGSVASEFQRGPFQIETLADFLSGGNGTSIGASSDLTEAEFIVLDNVATLLTYNSMESVQAFLSKFVTLVMKNKHGHIVTALVMDKELHGPLFEYISSIADMVIELTPDMQVMQMAPGIAKVSAAPGAQAGVEVKDVIGA